MASRKCKAYLGLAATDFQGIIIMANRFLDFLYKETILFVDPIISKTDFALQIKLASDAVQYAIRGSIKDRSKRNAECKILHRMMTQKLLPYINRLYAGNCPYIERSGAKCTGDPTPVLPPDTPIIMKIEKGTLPNSVKVFLVRGINSKQKRRSRIFYRIFMFENESDTKRLEVGSTYNSTDLIGKDIPTMVYRYYAVAASNSNGSSLPSKRERFFLTD
jgi:hypothetical protein